jgi:hypothetical protein
MQTANECQYKAKQIFFLITELEDTAGLTGHHSPLGLFTQVARKMYGYIVI